MSRDWYVTNSENCVIEDNDAFDDQIEFFEEIDLPKDTVYPVTLIEDVSPKYQAIEDEE